MKKIMDKFKSSIKSNKKLIIFLIALGVIALIAGSVFTIMLNSSDKQLVSEYINNFINNLSNNQLDYKSALQNGIISYFSFIIVIWLLGISVIGIPVILFMYFSKIFVLGFSISSIIANYGFKGCLISLGYVFPHQIINMIVYSILTIASLKVAAKLLFSILKKEKLDFKVILNNYLYILLGSIVLGSLMVLFEVYLTPKIISIFLPLIK